MSCCFGQQIALQEKIDLTTIKAKMRAIESKSIQVVGYLPSGELTFVPKEQEEKLLTRIKYISYVR